MSAGVAREGCREAEKPGGCSMLVVEATRGAWSMVSLVGCRCSARSLRTRGASPLRCHGLAFLLDHSQHVTTVHASGRPRAVQQPPNDARSTHGQIQAWVQSSHLRFPAALQSIPGFAQVSTAPTASQIPKTQLAEGPSFSRSEPLMLLLAVPSRSAYSYENEFINLILATLPILLT